MAERGIERRLIRVAAFGKMAFRMTMGIEDGMYDLMLNPRPKCEKTILVKTGQFVVV